jgi:predicted transcriptional regulator
MRALSIRQPYAELILRGLKPIEFRSRPTKIIGERFYIYASKKPAAGSGQMAEVREQRSEITGQKSDDANLASSSLASDVRPLTSDNLSSGVPPTWMLDVAEALRLWGPDVELPTGVIVGSAVVERVTRGSAFYEWHLADVQRVKKFRKPKGHPQPVWFNPF